MKKKALSLLLASCMIAGTLAGCGGGTSQQPAAERTHRQPGQKRQRPRRMQETTAHPQQRKRRL